MDLRNRLDEIAGPAVPPTETDVEADLARGRRALRRRRAAQAVGGSAFSVAALVAAVAIATSGVDSTGTGPRATGQPATAGAAHLVAYTGKQPKGFTIDKVPDGWFVQADDESSIILAPSRIQGKPGVDPSKDPLYDPRSFVGKIGVYLESKDRSSVPDGDKVEVGGKTGVLAKPLGTEDGRSLWVPHRDGVYLVVQFWDGSGLSHDEMVDFGRGVHVNKGAGKTVG